MGPSTSLSEIEMVSSSVYPIYNHGEDINPDKRGLLTVIIRFNESACQSPDQSVGVKYIAGPGRSHPARCAIPRLLGVGWLPLHLQRAFQSRCFLEPVQLLRPAV